MNTLTIPTPESTIPGFAQLHKDIQQVLNLLSEPFPIEEMKVRPGTINREGTSALALIYNEWWTGYLPRLNDLVGPNNFKIRLQPWNDDVIAHLRAFGGLIEGWSSGSAKQDKLGPMEAEIQAKKRVVAEKLMLGLYLYFLPTVWMRGEYDQQRKQFYPAEGEERRCVWEMYRHAGLISPSSPGISIPRATSKEQQSAPHATGGSVRPAPVAASHSATPADTSSVITRTAQARAALADAEGRVGMRPSSPAAPTSTARTATQTTGALASDPQLGLIARLLNERRGTTDTTSDQAAASVIDAIGARFGISSLSRLRSKADLRGTHLSKANATKLIDALKAFDGGTAAQAA